MLHKHVSGILSLELANPSRIPEFTGNAQVLAAAHQRIGPATFCGCWDAVRSEVILFAAGYRDKPVITLIYM